MRIQSGIELCLIIVGLLIPLFLFVMVQVPANSQYNQLFSTYYSDIQSPSNFTITQSALLTFWSNLNDTLPDTIGWTNSQSKIYLFSQDLDKAVQTQATFIENNESNTTQYKQWYSTTVNRLTIESAFVNDLQQSISPLWYLGLYPMAYFDWVFWLLSAFLVATGLVLLHHPVRPQ